MMSGLGQEMMTENQKVQITFRVTPCNAPSLLAIVDALEGNDWYDDIEHVEAIEHLIDSFIGMRLSPEAKADALTAFRAFRNISDRKQVPWE